jgi:hypothetical protein
MKRNIFAAAVLALVAVASGAVAAGMVALPKGYQKWNKSKQQVVTDKKSLFYGIHHTYVNTKAMPVFKKGGVYPEGSMFVVEQFGIRQVDGKSVPGKKSMIVIMKKDKRFAATGGWEFAGFTADGKPSGIDPAKNCFSCHLKDAADRDFVISRYTDFR